MNFSRTRQPAGLILLVVLSMLAFLGVLVIAYVSFSSKSQRTSFALASREFHAPPVDDLFEEALMKLVRGTGDPTDPFYGEDLLTDLYGRKDLLNVSVRTPMSLREQVGGGNLFPERRPVHVGGGFVRFPVDLDSITNWNNNPADDPDPRPAWTHLDDAFAGRVITFGNGPLAMESFRVLRSTGSRAGGTPEFVNVDSFYIELDPSMVVTLGNGDTVAIDQLISSTDTHEVAALFYTPGGDGRYGTADDDDGIGGPSNYGEAGYPVDGPSPGPTDDQPYGFIVNPAPQNSPGIGLEATGRLTASRNVAGVNVDLPASFFPNVADGTKGTLGGDYDEAYDAPDYFNWFLAGRVRVPSAGGLFQDRIIPSFHRPSILNYLINTKDWSNSPTTDEVRGVAQALSRATFRPLPFANQHPGFSGGSSDFALSTPFQLPAPGNPASDPLIARLDRFFDALIRGGGYPPGDPRNGNPWDVDNDGDGIPDSVWVDIGLPLITSPEGKLLRPLIAPMIEDTGGKLNVNAHGGYAQVRPDYRNRPLNVNAPNQAWAGTTQIERAAVARGLGFGPAEIALPSRGLTGPVNADGSAIIDTELLPLLRQRSRWGSRPEPAAPNGNPVAGTQGNDALDALRTADRRRTHTAAGGVGFSSDPHGRGGVGVGRTGQLLASVSGTELQTEDLPNGVRTIDESINDPYELDPTGRLDGDSAYLFDELEAVLRDNSWDNDLLPTRLRTLLRNSLNDKAELARMLTTLSTSFDNPSAVPPVGLQSGTRNRQTLYTNNTLGSAQIAQVLLHRLRLDIAPFRQPPPWDLTQDRTMETAADYQDRLQVANERWVEIVAPELRQGRKIDVNRPFGNGIDDVDNNGNGNGVIDEPVEFGNGRDDNGNGLVDEAAEFYAALPVGPAVPWNDDAYPQATSGNLGPAVQNRFGGQIPDYNFGRRDIDLSASGRELLARHLYVLMMAMMSQIDETTGERYEMPVVDDSVVPNRQLYNARRIAQWAVNVVDYRDQDATMTRFIYDPNPLDGWDLAIDTTGNGTPDIGTGRFDQTQPGADPFPAEASPVVWGVESPELLFSEGHAFHDVRVRDTNLEGGGGGSRKDPMDPMADDDTDQVRIPQGSLFLELYCNRAWPNGDMPHLQGVPQELYRLNAANEFELRLDTVAPTAPGANVGAPVWRIAISEPHYQGSPNQDLNPRLLRQGYPDTYSFDPERPLELDDGSGLWNTPLEYDRIVVFNHVGTAAVANNLAAAMSPPAASGRQTIQGNQLFFAHNDDNAHLGGQRGIRPGQYLGLGPRTLTNFGSQIFPDGSLPVGVSPIRFALDTNEGFIQFGRGNNNRITPSTGVTGPIAPSVGMVIKTFRPDTWAADVFENGRVGLNVSEPLPRTPGYYPEPLEQYDGGTEYTIRDAYVDFSDTAATSPRDEPQDIAVLSPIGELSALQGTVPEPFIGLERDYCSAFLQRLADPLKPFDVVNNPYITVDWLTVDLTSFSGEEEQSRIREGVDPAVPAPEYARQTRARNGCDLNGNPLAAVFSYNTDAPDGRGPNDAPGTPPNPGGNPANLFAGRTNYFELDTAIGEGGIDSSYGYLNVGTRRFGRTLGASNGNTAMNSRDRGQPETPFSLHPWLNRPFASHMELMMVPATSPGRLFEEYTPINPTESVSPGTAPRYHPRAGEVVQPMGFPPTPNPTGDGEFQLFRGNHRHLLNFFQGSELEEEVAQFPRVLDYVTTLPRFRGEIELINPDRVTLLTGMNAAGYGSRAFGDVFQPPFNFVHDGRRQGQINLNTLSDYPVWIGLMHGHLIDRELRAQEGDIGEEIAFQDFQRSRRGYPVDGTVMQRRIFDGNVQARPSQWYNYAPEMLDGRFPTQYAGMYRNIADADMAPVLPEIAGQQPPKLGRAGVVNSLLRQDVDAADTWDTPLPPTPFFVRENQNDTHRDVDRNPFAHYQTLMRMPNLVSKDSQVFIVRVTMGFFEVDPNSANSLGREYKEEIAENERYQMLYLIDRSKPVGFVPGEDLNARDVVVYERRLQ